MDYQHIRKGFQILFQLNVIAAIYVLEQNMQGMSDVCCVNSLCIQILSIADSLDVTRQTSISTYFCLFLG